MRPSILKTTTSIGLCALLAACDATPTDGDQGGYLRATLQPVLALMVGDVAGSAEGNSMELTDIEFQGGANVSGGTKSDTHRKWAVDAKDLEHDRSLHLQRLTSAPEGRFKPGVYTLVPRNFTAGDNDGYTALYVDLNSGSHFIAESGTLTITGVAADGETTGYFDFMAAYWCNAHNDRARCFQSPAQSGFRPDAIRLRVHGDFRAPDVSAVSVPLF